MIIMSLVVTCLVRIWFLETPPLRTKVPTLFDKTVVFLFLKNLSFASSLSCSRKERYFVQCVFSLIRAVNSFNHFGRMETLVKNGTFSNVFFHYRSVILGVNADFSFNSYMYKDFGAFRLRHTQTSAS